MSQPLLRAQGGSDEACMTLTGHLDELRRRLLRSIGAVAAGALLCQFFIDDLTQLLTAPAGTLYFMKPAEAFFMYFKLLIAGGVAVASPVIFYEFWAFLMPAFSRQNRKTLTVLVLSSLTLFIAGGALAFFVVVPQGLRFFLSFGGNLGQPLISMENYLSFVIALVLPFGLVFNLPLALLILAKMGLVSSAGLKSKRRFLIFASFVASAVLTATTDVFSQCLLALPMILLYEISCQIIRYFIEK